MFGFFSAAQRRKLCTARWPSIWYLLFIATLSFSWQKMTPGTVWPGLRVATFYELTDILQCNASPLRLSCYGLPSSIGYRTMRTESVPVMGVPSSVVPFSTPSVSPD